MQTGDIPDLDEATRVTLFRAVRELLINVARHSGTNQATVAIQGAPEGVTVAVEDHGRGFDAKARMGGFGLRNLVDRIESQRGRVVIDSAPQRGAKISVVVPAQRRSS